MPRSAILFGKQASLHCQIAQLIQKRLVAVFQRNQVVYTQQRAAFFRRRAQRKQRKGQGQADGKKQFFLHKSSSSAREKQVYFVKYTISLTSRSREPLVLLTR